MTLLAYEKDCGFGPKPHTKRAKANFDAFSEKYGVKHMSSNLPLWVDKLRALDKSGKIFDHVNVAYTEEGNRVVVAQPYEHAAKALPAFIDALSGTEFHINVMDSWYYPGKAMAYVISD